MRFLILLTVFKPQKIFEALPWKAFLGTIWKNFKTEDDISNHVIIETVYLRGSVTLLKSQYSFVRLTDILLNPTQKALRQYHPMNSNMRPLLITSVKNGTNTSFLSTMSWKDTKKMKRSLLFACYKSMVIIVRPWRKEKFYHTILFILQCFN